jgi:molybdopterin converting factor small subunit
MQKLTNGQTKVEVEGSTVRQIIENLDKIYPGMKDRLAEGTRIKRGISVAVDGEVTPLGMLGQVKEDSEVHFLPSIAGG